MLFESIRPQLESIYPEEEMGANKEKANAMKPNRLMTVLKQSLLYQLSLHQSRHPDRPIDISSPLHLSVLVDMAPPPLSSAHRREQASSPLRQEASSPLTSPRLEMVDPRISMNLARQVPWGPTSPSGERPLTAQPKMNHYSDTKHLRQSTAGRIERKRHESSGNGYPQEVWGEGSDSNRNNGADGWRSSASSRPTSSHRAPPVSWTIPPEVTEPEIIEERGFEARGVKHGYQDMVDHPEEEREYEMGSDRSVGDTLPEEYEEDDAPAMSTLLCVLCIFVCVWLTLDPFPPVHLCF